METTVICTFEQRLTTSDIGKLARMVGAVIPIPDRHHLITSTQIGLYPILQDKTRDYARVRTRLREMTLTVLRQVEGNQMVLGIPIHGRCYQIINTGPVPWEKGDVLTTMAPLFATSAAPVTSIQNGLPGGGFRTGDQTPSVVQVSDWRLILPWIVPLSLATELNQRLLLMALLQLDRSREEVRAASAQLRTLHYRDVTIIIPEPTLNDTALTDLRNVCISLSMIVNLSSDVTLTYVRKLALEDNSMILTKCQEILNRGRTPGGGIGGGAQGPGPGDAGTGAGPVVPAIGVRQPLNLTPAEELNKLTTLFVMTRQIVEVIAEQPFFVVCDLSPDDRSALCIFKG